MELITNIIENQKEITNHLEQNGYGVEHSYWNLFYLQGENTKSALLKNQKSSAMCIHYNNMWELLPGAITQNHENRFEAICQALDHLFENETDKTMIVVPNHFKQLLIDTGKYDIPKSHTTFYLPKYNLKGWDQNLEGSKWKKMRNLYNSFIKKHNPQFTDINNINKEQLIKLVQAWKQKRSASTVWQPQFYDNILKNNFKGLQHTFSVTINNNPHTICGGWNIPNSNDYYSVLGLLDYSHTGLGEVATIMEFNHLKEQGYNYVHTGQSDKRMLTFKKKFHPETIDKEILLSVRKK